MHVGEKLVWDYNEEIELALNRLIKLAEKEKMETEFFDDRNNLLSPVSTFVRSRFDVDRDSMKWLISNLVSLHTWYEAILTVWTEKVDFNPVSHPVLFTKQLRSGKKKKKKTKTILSLQIERCKTLLYGLYSDEFIVTVCWFKMFHFYCCIYVLFYLKMVDLNIFCKCFPYNEIINAKQF